MSQAPDKEVAAEHAVAGSTASIITPVRSEILSNELVTVSQIEKRFGTQQVLRSLSCVFNSGEIVLLLGANGAGKSTLLRICTGLIKPDKGTINLAIKNSQFSYVAHEPMLYANLTVRENLEFFGALTGKKHSVPTDLKQWGLAMHAEKRIDELSRGLQMRVSLARAMQSEPRVLFLDEPTSALDEESVQALSGTLLTVVHSGSQSGLAVIATHDIERLRPIANRIILINGGRIEQDSNNLESEGMGESAACDAVVTRYQKGNR